MKKTVLLILFSLLVCSGQGAPRKATDEKLVRETMKRATAFMYDSMGNEGGFLWSYLRDKSRVWGELEAYPSMIWIESATPLMGQLMLDAYHATGDEYYYDMAVKSARMLIFAQLPCGGWGYKFDTAGIASEKRWFETIGKNAWGMGEHNHFYGNATFDDSVFGDSVEFLLRIYLEKKDPQFRPALDKAIGMLYDSQFPIGGWPQRWPLMNDYPNPQDGSPDYTGCITLNDGVAAKNIALLLKVYLLMGDGRAYEPLTRAINCMAALQQGSPSSGWADQYYADLTPASARGFEPAAVSTALTKDVIYLLMDYYRLTGDARLLNGIPAAIEFLSSSALGERETAVSGRKPADGQILCPRFVKPGTTVPLYLHRHGSHVVNGRYFADQNPENVIEHYSSFVVVGIEKIKRDYKKIKEMSPEEAVKDSPLLNPVKYQMPDYYTSAIHKADPSAAPEVIASLDSDGCWIVPLTWALQAYVGPGSKDDPVPTIYSETVGHPRNTASLESGLTGVTLKSFIENMSVLISSLKGVNP